MEYLTKLKNACMFKSLSTVMEDHNNKEDRIITDYNEMNEIPIIRQPIMVESKNPNNDNQYNPPNQSFIDNNSKQHEESPFSKFKIWGQPK